MGSASRGSVEVVPLRGPMRSPLPFAGIKAAHRPGFVRYAGSDFLLDGPLPESSQEALHIASAGDARIRIEGAYQTTHEMEQCYLGGLDCMVGLRRSSWLQYVAVTVPALIDMQAYVAIRQVACCSA